MSDPTRRDTAVAFLIAFLCALFVVLMTGCASQTRSTEQVQVEKWDKVTVNGSLQMPTPDGVAPVPFTLTIDRSGGESRDKTAESKTAIDGAAIGREIAAALGPVIMAAKGGGMPWTNILGAGGTALVAATTGYLALKKREQMKPAKHPRADA